MFLYQHQILERLIIENIGKLDIELQCLQVKEGRWEHVLQDTVLHGQAALGFSLPCKCICHFVSLLAHMQ